MGLGRSPGENCPHAVTLKGPRNCGRPRGKSTYERYSSFPLKPQKAFVGAGTLHGTRIAKVRRDMKHIRFETMDYVKSVEVVKAMLVAGEAKAGLPVKGLAKLATEAGLEPIA